MKITPNTYKPTLPERSQPLNAYNKTQANHAKPSSSEVALSSTARHLQQVQATSTHDVNVSRVEALRNAVANGTYEINSHRIADGLLASTRELFN